MIEQIKKYLTWKFAAGIALGAAGGYAYYYFIGCEGGTCAITSSPVNSVLYGMLLGGILSFGKKKEVNEDPGSTEA